jgi:DNA-binding ferritin-like protein
MKKLAIKFREAQIFAHAAHNLVQGSSFFSDHEFLGEAYEAYTKAYDDTIERMIGLGTQEVNPLNITAEAANDALENYKLDNADSYDIFYALLGLEKNICEIVRDIIEKGVTHGTSNLLEGFADQSEMRQYKINQRIL